MEVITMKKRIVIMCMAAALLGASLPAMSMSVYPGSAHFETAFDCGFAAVAPISVTTVAPIVGDDILSIGVDSIRSMAAARSMAVAGSTDYFRQGITILGRNVKALARSLVFEHPYVSGAIAVAAVLAYKFRKNCRSLFGQFLSQTRFAKHPVAVTQLVPPMCPAESSAHQELHSSCGDSSCQAGPSQIVENHSSIRPLTKDKKEIVLVPGEIYQGRSIKQKEAECGCYAKYNALAIAALLENHEVVSPQAIRHKVTELVAHGGVANWVDETTVFADLAASLPGKNVYMLKVENINDSGDIRVVPAGATPDPEALSMDDFWMTVRDQATESVGYFIVNLAYPVEIQDDKSSPEEEADGASKEIYSGHWILVVALKQPGQTAPVFLYFDSQNRHIKDNPYARYLIPYFREHATGVQV
jgi:hypothetical protein